MLNRFKQTRKNKKYFKTTPLGVEQLETRLMNAVGGMQQQLQLLLSPHTIGSTNVVSSTNAAPTMQTQARMVSGSQVTGTFTNLTGLGADKEGEAGLTYSWIVVAKPSGSTATFTVNDSNQAKNTRVDFTKAGNYDLQVSARDAGGLSVVSKLRVTVAQTVTQLSLATSSGATITDEQTIVDKTQRVVVRGTDQFGNAMATIPSITWTQVKGPTGANPMAATGSRESVLTFNKLGAHTLRAKSGNATVDLKTNVVEALTSIRIADSNNRAMPTNAAVSGTGNNIVWTARGLDQFGSVMKSQPTLEWSVASAPRGSSPSLVASGDKVTLGFDRVGAYSFQVKSGNVAVRIPVAIAPTLTRIELLTQDAGVVNSQTPIETTIASQRFTVRGLDQFNQTMSSIPSLTWSTVNAPASGSATGTLNRGVATIAFTGSGLYSLRVKGGMAETDFKINVVQTMTSLVALNEQRVAVSTASPVKTDTKSANVTLQGRDQFGKVMTSSPAVTWSTITAPSQGEATVATKSGVATVSFSKAGNYTLRAVLGSLTVNVPVQVAQRLSGISINSTASEVASNATARFQVSGTDQFGNSMLVSSGINWTATGGTISNQGVYTAGTVIGNYVVTARVGTFSTQSPIKVIAPVIPTPTPTPPPTPPTTPSVSAVRSLANTLHSDNSISRAEMIQLLRSAGTDGSVSQVELEDLRWVVSTSGGFFMPVYVRELARDVVNSNAANLRYKGQNAGNLAAGSSGVQLNNLVDKWFMGSDEPAILGSGISYQNATGNLFNGTPSRNDGRQGYLGDCYFIASLTSIADRSAAAVQNMFLDNGDGTFTIRFYANGGADYVTVNRRLPTLANGTLAYSGLGLNVSSSSTSLWVALAEKAYAQWNETGNAGRNGTNTYAGIEGGWMSNVNAQVLGYSSSNHSVASTTKQQLINFLGSGKAVTIGTNSSVASGWVGGHAYIINSYNAGTDTFDVYNPWGFNHAGSVSWAQIQANCSFYAVTDSSGTTAISATSVRSAMTDVLLGNWTTVETRAVIADTTTGVESRSIDFGNEEQEPALVGSIHEWVTPAQDCEWASEDTSEEERVLADLHAIATDLAFGTDFDSLFS
jgi:hypothetical protein